MTVVRGSAADLHAGSAAAVAGDVADPVVRVLDATAPAVVLGSSQPADHVDAARAAAAGIAVVRRRSGGGAVLVGPGRCLWVDIVIGRGDPRWDDDVARAAWWVGDAWTVALSSIGVAGAEAWRQGMARRRWSDRVCFVGVGPGEVVVGGRKVVGISQRRTRAGVLFQCAALLDGDQTELLDVLALDDAERREVAAALVDTTRALARGAAGPLGESLVSVLTGPAATADR